MPYGAPNRPNRPRSANPATEAGFVRRILLGIPRLVWTLAGGVTLGIGYGVKMNYRAGGVRAQGAGSAACTASQCRPSCRFIAAGAAMIPRQAPDFTEPRPSGGRGGRQGQGDGQAPKVMIRTTTRMTTRVDHHDGDQHGHGHDHGDDQCRHQHPQRYQRGPQRGDDHHQRAGQRMAGCTSAAFGRPSRLLDWFPHRHAHCPTASPRSSALLPGAPEQQHQHYGDDHDRNKERCPTAACSCVPKICRLTLPPGHQRAQGIASCLDYESELDWGASAEAAARLSAIEAEAERLHTAIHEAANKFRTFLWFDRFRRAHPVKSNRNDRSRPPKSA